MALQGIVERRHGIICASKERLNLCALFPPLRELFDTSVNYLPPSAKYLMPPQNIYPTP